MRILLINNDGGGFNDRIQLEEGTTVESVVANHSNGRRANDFMVRVNREVVPMGYVLKDGDRLTMTPTKIEGAR